jgi:hypothetical protein
VISRTTPSFWRALARLNPNIRDDQRLLLKEIGQTPIADKAIGIGPKCEVVICKETDALHLAAAAYLLG